MRPALTVFETVCSCLSDVQFARCCCCIYLHKKNVWMKRIAGHTGCSNNRLRVLGVAVRVRAHTNIHNAHICMATPCTQIYTCTRTHAQAHTRTHIRTRIHTPLHARTHANTHTYIPTHTRMHTRTRTQPLPHTSAYPFTLPCSNARRQ